MSSLRKRNGVWNYRYLDSDGVQRERKGTTDRRVTQQLADAAERQAKQIREGLIDPKALGFRDHESRPLVDHLADFRRAMEAKGRTLAHAKVTEHRARRILASAGAVRISELSLSKTQEAVGTLRDKEKFGAETINHHVRAVKGFARWLWKDNRAREHVLAHLSTSSAEADRRHRRRALTTQEASKLVQVTESGPPVKGLSGPDRAALYALALGTGFRRNELRSLTPERFDLDANLPTVTCLACYSKNGHEAIQPLPAALVPRLRHWLASHPAGQPMFSRMSNRTSEMLAVDLGAAGITQETPEGILDFHALRATYVTHLVASGASVKTCQVLARHSTPSLTIGLYAKASLQDVEGAVNALPDLTRRPLAANSDQQHIGNPSSLAYPYALDADRRSVSQLDGTRKAGSDRAGGLARRTPDAGRPHENQSPDADSRNVTLSVVPIGSECMREEGLEPSRLAAQDPKSGAEFHQSQSHEKPSGTIVNPTALTCPYSTADLPSDLAFVLERWPSVVARWGTLAESLRAGIVALVGAASEKGGRGGTE